MAQHQSNSLQFLGTKWHMIIGITLALLASLCLLADTGLTSSEPLNYLVRSINALVGQSSTIYFILIIVAGLWQLLPRTTVNRPFIPHFISHLGLLVFLSLPILNLLNNTSYTEAIMGKSGGLIGLILVQLAKSWWGLIIVVGLYGVSIVLIWSHLIGRYAQQFIHALTKIAGMLRRWGTHLIVEESAAIVARRQVVVMQRKKDVPTLPTIQLLNKGNRQNANHTIDVANNQRIIEQTLIDFGLVGEVKTADIRDGPTITQFGITPGYVERSDGTHKKVRIAQIATLRPDFALALAVPRLRIEAPVPGRGIVGIEIPNKVKTIVQLRDVVESAAFNHVNKRLTLALGKDVSGESIAIDLAKMPHLLIAGTTGSGKSVCMKALITALITTNTPEQLRLILIDPKRVEMVAFNGLPHLYGTAEVEGERVMGVLRWIVAEMDRRYALFAQANARQLATYNDKMIADNQPIMPHLVVFIDELADLMAQFSAETERTLCRLAQMARATGIHLVVATQRPSTDVITGLIKANFPARIAFSVTSSIDSRVILDTTGAEQLLGDGDMLFLGSGASMPRRIQGCFVSDEEIARVVSWWKQNRRHDEPSPPPWNDLLAKMKMVEDTDNELERAIELCQKYDTVSASLIQRRLRIGFPRAARIMRNLYEMGLVEHPKRGGKTRKTHVSEGDGDVFGRIAREHTDKNNA